ncbi:replication initiator protein A [Tautonia plasticadhaerens]|uniref:Replication initiator protein A n=1 Tax=Tautonia plasticadhaerens TaxID=2527974 RepID=A0A518GYP7_9BACT|nr:replication initiator protein A [Tautonia plasticadhaerens]QDV33721.1 Replication initiator protein A [Tautonia plasticadhaerens]
MSKEGVAEILPHRHGPQRYRDELNFAEFPIASVSDTVAENQKTLEFTDEIFDPSSGKPVARTLTITAADKFGLPTALDDEVLLGLMQLSCDQGFTDRKVHFSRYELIKLLGWRDESKSYKRIEDSLNRWTGVTLQYRKAWWSKEEQCWVNETFHVIDQVTVFDRERIARRRKMAKGSPEKALSSFVWNETVFQSFKSGYIKSLDFDFFKSLDSAISKRMFRFLDKRFYHKGRWEFDLQTFACEHIGLSKNYSNSELKRKLLPAVREIEARGFLAPLADAERFLRLPRANWKAVFVKAAKKLAVIPQEGDDSLVSELVARGITPRSARKLVSHHPSSRIEEKVRLFDGLKTRGGEGAIRNRAGWLYSAIVHNYTDAEAVAVPAATPRRDTAAAPPPRAKSDPPEESLKPEAVAFEAFWAALDEGARRDFEAAAVAAAPAFLQKQFHEGSDAKGSLWKVTRQRILVDFFSCSRAG